MGASLTMVCLTGCADIGYYLQAARGQLHMMQAARPIETWLQEEATPPELKRQLELARRLRVFAVEVLHLPDNASYHRYADLGRRAAVWNATAAPPYSLKLKTWCFPVTGCIGYRGYFDERDAQALAMQLRRDGLEASVYGVPAYSTLGWLNWLGGDPLLNTFISYPEGELARMLFHELAHQLVYVQDDTTFNESFATAVERLGSARWLATQAGEDARTEYARFDSRRRAFRALMLATRERLEAVYADTDSPVPMAERKAQAMASFRSEYEALKRERWQGYAGYDAYVERANNASFGVQAAYDGLVPSFEALFEREGGDWPRFYAAVHALAARPKAERDRALALLRPRTEVARID
jgi:predicted aminopeptidase